MTDGFFVGPDCVHSQQTQLPAITFFAADYQEARNNILEAAQGQETRRIGVFPRPLVTRLQPSVGPTEQSVRADSEDGLAISGQRRRQ